MPTRVDRNSHPDVRQRMLPPRIVERFCCPRLLDRRDAGLNAVESGRVVRHLQLQSPP
jgi:hypothetical protein